MHPVQQQQLQQQRQLQQLQQQQHQQNMSRRSSFTANGSGVPATSTAPQLSMTHPLQLHPQNGAPFHPNSQTHFANPQQAQQRMSIPDGNSSSASLVPQQGGMSVTPAVISLNSNHQQHQLLQTRQQQQGQAQPQSIASNQLVMNSLQMQPQQQHHQNNGLQNVISGGSNGIGNANNGNSLLHLHQAQSSEQHQAQAQAPNNAAQPNKFNSQNPAIQVTLTSQQQQLMQQKKLIDQLEMQIAQHQRTMAEMKSASASNNHPGNNNSSGGNNNSGNNNMNGNFTTPTSAPGINVAGDLNMNTTQNMSAVAVIQQQQALQMNKFQMNNLQMKQMNIAQTQNNNKNQLQQQQQQHLPPQQNSHSQTPQHHQQYMNPMKIASFDNNSVRKPSQSSNNGQTNIVTTTSTHSVDNHALRRYSLGSTTSVQTTQSTGVMNAGSMDANVLRRMSQLSQASSANGGAPTSASSSNNSAAVPSSTATTAPIHVGSVENQSVPQRPSTSYYGPTNVASFDNSNPKNLLLRQNPTVAAAQLAATGQSVNVNGATNGINTLMSVPATAVNRNGIRRSSLLQINQQQMINANNSLQRPSSFPAQAGTAIGMDANTVNANKQAAVVALSNRVLLGPQMNQFNRNQQQLQPPMSNMLNVVHPGSAGRTHGNTTPTPINLGSGRNSKEVGHVNNGSACENAKDFALLKGSFAGGWQSNNDLPERRRIIILVAKLIDKMQPSGNDHRK